FLLERTRELLFQKLHVFANLFDSIVPIWKNTFGVLRETFNSRMRKYFVSLKDQMIKRGYNVIITYVEV
ncbi:hypothetical protein Golax_009343, partial [Gossypium laxum]|nr:hypothetical protein [Gossypium laxum]